MDDIFGRPLWRYKEEAKAMRSSPTVLVVEDEALVRFQIVQVLEQAGCIPLEAADADKAISVVNSEPSLKAVITDIQMPGKLDGIGLSHYVSRLRPDVKIILSSARERPPPSALPPGAEFIPKPVDHRKLAAVADELCS